MHTDPNLNSPDFVQPWDAYWQGAGDLGAFSSAGTDHPAIAGFWLEFFESQKSRFEAPRIVDLASGNGALLALALAALDGKPAGITCVDISEAAIANIRDRFPDVQGVVGDVRDTSLPAAAFDIVTSQFGIEYAGNTAAREAIRLVAPGGRLALLLHHDDSRIHHDCVASLDAVSRVCDSGFIPLAIDFFRAGFEAVRGADRQPYDDAATKLNPAIRVVEETVAEHGEEVAGGVLASLYTDVRKMHERIQHYEPSEVLTWLQTMGSQLEDYVSRMTTMHAAALDESSFAEICDIVTDAGHAIDQSGPLFAAGEKQPLAWALLATA